MALTTASRTTPARLLYTGVVALALSVPLSGTTLAQAGPGASLGPPEAQPLVEPPAEPSGDGTGVRLSTTLGDIVIGLFTDSAPVAAENFVNLVEAGFYEGSTFHRLVPGFVIQAGAPAGSEASGPGYAIPDEPVVGRYGRGIVAMARTPAPDSAGSQFFIVLDDRAEASLEAARTYVILGRVVEGMEVVDAIAAGPNAGPPDNAALEPVAITSATLERVALPPEPEREPLALPGHADPELEGLYPEGVGGLPLAPTSFSADVILEGVPDDDPFRRVVAMVEAKGREPADLTIATAAAGEGEDFVGILAARLRDVPATEVADELTPILLRADPGIGGSDVVIAGREVRRVEPGTALGGEAPVHILVSGEVVWYVVGPDALVEEVIAALP